MDLGWSRFGKHEDRPPEAEKLRQQPWSIKLPKGASSDDILCLDRRGKGQLVFARESSLAPQSALYVDLQDTIQALGKAEAAAG